MKELISIIVIMSLLGSLTACATNNEKETQIKLRTTEPTTAPIVTPEASVKTTSNKNETSWNGVGIYDRCLMTTSKEGNNLTVQITWGDTAYSSYQYDFSGTLNDDVLSYSNLVEKEITTDETNKISENILNEDLSGEIFFHNNMALWDNNGSTVVLAKDDEYIEDATKIDYTGSYGSLGIYSRVTLKVSQKDSQVSGTLYWSQSAAEQYVYTFGGTIDGNRAILDNIKTTKVTYKEDGSKKEKVIKENGSGTIFFSKDFITVMSDEDDFVVPFIA